MSLNDYKPLIKSTTFWGVVVSVLGKLGAVAGYEVSAADEQAIVSLISLAISGVGDALAIVGRVKATKKIG
jgi:hypothetical protein